MHGRAVFASKHQDSEYGVVMRNEAPSVSNALKARSSVADSYQYILDQLEIAIEKAPDWKKLSQASKEAAKKFWKVDLFLL